MQNANQILTAMQKLGEKRLPLTRVYRSLFSEEMYLAAYSKIYRNQGALTPGTANETADGMSLALIREIIDDLRAERFRFRPSRRSHVPKKSGGTRPLGMPDFPEKLVQEVIRALLEAYYEPRFRNSSHGFRPERGCHTALTQIKQKFRGSTWFIEGDIRGCFDNINHQVLMAILARDIQDGRLLNLIRLSLEAGVVEEWEYKRTHSGTPQGGILSPLLANIYLHELDAFVEDVLIPQYTQGKKRGNNLEYARYNYRIVQARKRGDYELAHKLELERRKLPSSDTYDPNFRRLTYVRYADDFILGFTGSKSEAEAIKEAIGTFLRERLQLEMSPSKTLITHARTEKARFLNYAISIYDADHKLTYDKRLRVMKRSVNGHIRLGVPYGLVDEHCKRYMRNGKPVSEPALLFYSDAQIIQRYQERYRGLANYYKYATDRAVFGKLKGVMQAALVKTLAHKLRTSVSRVYRRYRGTREVNGKTYKTLQVEVPTRRGTRTIYWGAIPLTVIKPGTEPIDDSKHFEFWKGVRSDLIQRLQADTCELCGSNGDCEVHHVRKLSNLKQKWAGRKAKPEWVKRMITMQRKTLIVCKKCHTDIHAGRPIPKERMK